MYEPKTTTLLPWNKREGVFRPIVGWDIWVQTSTGDKRFVRVGNLHTSPAGSEFSRPNVFAQVEAPLSLLSKSSIPVVVGGDFYLTAEAVTRNWGSLSKSEKDAVAKYKNSLIKGLEEPLMSAAKELEEFDKKHPNNKKATKEQTSERERLSSQLRRLSDMIESLGTDQVQLLRNDPDACLSVEKRIQKMGLHVEQSLTGTNWKTRGVHSWYDGQIADFFVRSGMKKDDWASARVGLVHPGGGMRIYDSAMLLAKYWRFCSDHFPIGIMLSTLSNDPALDAPFDAQSALLSWTPAPYTAVQRDPTDLLGIINNGFQCYVNAALQLVARMGLNNYVQGQGDFEQAYQALRDETLGILQTRDHEGQNATYVAYGRYHRYTTARTIGLRSELVASQAAQTVYSQEDSGEALAKILQAFDKRVGNFDPGIAGHLESAIDQNNFAAFRPSSCHFILRIDTTYHLGVSNGNAHGNIVRVNDHGVHRSYQCDNFLQIAVPDPSKKRAQEEVLDDELDSSEPAFKKFKVSGESDDLAPLDLADLLRSTWDVTHDDRQIQAVDTATHHYPNAYRIRERSCRLGPSLLASSCRSSASISTSLVNEDARYRPRSRCPCSS